MDNQRLKTFQQAIKSQKLDGFIITNPINIFYLTGFRGISATERESILIFCPSPILITASLYQNEARKVAGKNLKVKIVPERNLIFEKAKELITGRKRVGFEANDLRFSEYQELNDNYLIPCKDLIEKMRLFKDADEIAKIEKAQIISQKAYGALVKSLKVGQTEEEIADKLRQIIKSLGAQGLAFDSIVASGSNSGKPHHVTSNKRLTKNDILLLDFGAQYQDYCADLSRTIFVGKATDVQKNLYNHVLTAQQKALAKITNSSKSQNAYHAANNHFKKHKLDKYFTHSLGHGVGLEVHEAPYLRPNLRTGDYQLLTTNMVFSVEPGLYFPWGGIRIEDLVVIQNGKAKVLGKLTEEIIEIS